MGKKVPAKFHSFDADGREQTADILIDEETGEEVQPDEKPIDLKATSKPPSKDKP